jgi:hypothetical protein
MLVRFSNRFSKVMNGFACAHKIPISTCDTSWQLSIEIRAPDVLCDMKPYRARRRMSHQHRHAHKQKRLPSAQPPTQYCHPCLRFLKAPPRQFKAALHSSLSRLHPSLC